ncbi:hypothetical protein Tco_1268680 [Tanacetum coccineum]
MWNDQILSHKGPSEIRDIDIANLRLKFNAFKALKGEKVQQSFTWLKILLNALENKDVKILQYKVNASHFLPMRRDYTRGQRERVGAVRTPMDKSKETYFGYGTKRGIDKGLVAESFD